MSNIRPINDNVLIKQGMPEKEKTAGGLYIPDTAREKPLEGEVVAVSKELETTVSVGDIVLYKKYAGTETSFNGIDYVVIPVGDILARIVDADIIP